MSIADTEHDLSLGLWRKTYQRDLTDRAINSLSMSAELTRHRIALTCDDFGNTHGDPDLLIIQAYPRRREVTQEMFAGWLDELERGGFITFYEAAGDRFLHMNRWLIEQPAPRNGKRVRRYPASPAEAQETPPETPKVSPDDSECIQMHPDSTGASRCIRAPHTQNKPIPRTGPETDPAQPQADDQQQAQDHAEASGSGGGLDSSREGEGSGGSGGVNNFGRTLSADMAKLADVSRQSAVAKRLAELGVDNEVTRRTLAARKDITLDVLNCTMDDIGKSGKADNPVGVLVHRLKTTTFHDWKPPRNARRPDGTRYTEFPEGEMKARHL